MRRKKIGRNEPCWCGSGKKYKKCHLNRQSQAPVNPWDVADDFRDKFSTSVCSVPTSYKPNCSNKIIKAHTVPKSSSLKAIARNGHVYGLNCSLESIQKYQGKAVCDLIGINKASTFSGFCSVHDGPLFEPIEQVCFSNTPKQCFLLAYRAFAREAYTKTAMTNVITDIIGDVDKGRPADFQEKLQTSKFLMDVGAQAGIRDNQHHKTYFDKYLESGDYKNIRAVSFEFKEPPPIMASGATNPTHDFRGNRIQDLMDVEIIPDCWSVTSFYDGNSGWIVFSWLEHCHKSCQLVMESLLEKPKNEWPIYLVQYLFDNFENFFISPDWWEKTSSVEQDKILNLVNNNASISEDVTGDGISTPQLSIKFPVVSSVRLINWTSKI